MKKDYIDKAEVSEAPEELMAQVGPVSSDISVAPPGLKRPKSPMRPKKAQSAVKYPEYRIIRDLTIEKNGKKGRHVLFTMEGDGWVQYMVNLDPYFGEMIHDAKNLYNSMKHDFDLEMKRVSQSFPNVDKAKRLVLENRESKEKDKGPVEEEIPPPKEEQSEFGFAKEIDERESHMGAIVGGWFGKYKTSQYWDREQRSWPGYEGYHQDLLDQSYEIFESHDNSKLLFLLESIFTKSAKYSSMKSELMRIHYEENPLKERSVRRLEKSIDEMSEAAFEIVVPEFKRWIYRHDDFEGWWAEFSYSLLVDGAVDNGSCSFDLSEEITEAASIGAKKMLAQESYELVEMYAEPYMDYFVEGDGKKEVMEYLKDNYREDISEWLNDNDISSEDFDSYIVDFISEENIWEEVASGTSFETWLLTEDSPLANFESFEDALEWFGDGNPSWIQIVKSVAEEHGMELWKQCYPGMETVEDNVRYAIKIMEDADTPLEKAAALSYALNVQHYFGNMMEDHVADGLDLSDLTGLDTEELDRLSNLEASFSDAMIKLADSTWTQSQVYCEDGDCYDVGKLIEITYMNNRARVKVDDLANQLHENAWGDDSVYVSPISVIRNPLLNKDHKIHMRRIQTADLSKPILIRFSDGKVIDGYHRLARAFMMEDKYIYAVYIQDEQMEDAKIES